MPSRSNPDENSKLSPLFLKQLDLMADLACEKIAARALELCAAIDAAPWARAKIFADNPGVEPEYLLELESVGRGLIIPELFRRRGPGYDRLKRCPIHTQRRFCDDLLDLVVPLPDGRYEVKKVHVMELTEEQARQVFDISDES